MRQHDGTRVAPALEPGFVPLDRVGRLCFDRVAVGHPDRRLEHVAQTQFPVLGEHGHEAARRPRGNGGERPVLGREVHPLRAVEGRCGAGGRDAEGVDRDDLFGLRVIDQRLGFAAPGEHVPHRRDSGEHGARRVDGVAALLEDHGARRGGERLAGDRDPVAPVQWGLLCALGRERDRQREENEREEADRHTCSDGDRTREHIVPSCGSPSMNAGPHRGPRPCGPFACR